MVVESAGVLESWSSAAAAAPVLWLTCTAI